MKYLNLSKNNLGDNFAISVADQMVTCDSYLKCLNLRHNKIKMDGIKQLSKAIASHHDIVSCDLRDNPGYDEHSDVNTLLKYSFLKNIRKSILLY